MAFAKDIMTKSPITIKENTPVKEAIQVILKKKISGLPVVADDMSLLGIISEKDLLSLTFYDSIDDAIVKDFINREVVSMPEETDLLEICELFMNNNFKRIPIVSGKKLVGILSRKDLLKFILESKQKS